MATARSKYRPLLSSIFTRLAATANKVLHATAASFIIASNRRKSHSQFKASLQKMGNNSSAQLANLTSEQLQKLIADCTCSICQEVFNEPVTLNCSHTFCKECVEKLRPGGAESLAEMLQLLQLMMSEGNGRTCPLCRANVEWAVPASDPQLLQNLKNLETVKQHCCQHEDCWQRVNGNCSSCGKRFCKQHHENEHEEARRSALEFRDNVLAFLQSKGMQEQLLELTAQKQSLPQVSEQIKEVTDQAFAELEHQLVRSMQKIEQQQEEELPKQLQQDLDQLEKMISEDDIANIENKLPAMRENLKASRQNRPDRLPMQQLTLENLEAAIGEVFARLEPRTYVPAYTHHEDEQKCSVKNKVRKEPWDMDMLTNVDDLVVFDSKLQFLRDQRNGAKLPGSCLVVNYKGFPTGQLHVFDLEINEIASIKLQFTSEGMPGRFRICNRQQRIVTTDAARNKCFIFSITGQVLHSFGSFGSGPHQMDQPLGCCMHANRLYIADSDNRRVLVYDAEDFNHIASIKHRELSSDICAVHVSDDFIVVLDSDHSRVTVFDSVNHSFVRVKELEADGFDLTADCYGNILVSLPNPETVQVLSPDCSISIKTFNVIVMGSKGERSGIPRLNGVAVDANSGRVFCGDTHKSRIVGFDLF